MELLAALVDLVLPSGCGGCGASARSGLCAGCASVLAQPPAPARPTPAPPGLPACVAGAEYDGPMRELILGYKERGRRDLTPVLGHALAGVVRAGWPDPGAGPVVLVPVPATAAAVRARHGDHMHRLARRAAADLRRDGYDAAVATPLRALPRVDSAQLDREQRAAAAHAAFVVRPAASRLAALRAIADRGAVVLVDDVLTTGATLAAATRRLLEHEIVVTFAASLAATRLRGR